MATARSPEEILAELQALVANQEISILKLSESITSEVAQRQENPPRTSDISSASLGAPTPASLEADLEHYRELFAKLRFSYVEQVTKEKFIRAIVGDPPLIVSPQENFDLETQNLEAKAMLKALKTEVADMVAELEKKASYLSQKYQGIQTEIVELQEMPEKLAELESIVTQLRLEQAAELHANPDLNLPLAKTAQLVDKKRRERENLDRQLEQLQNQVPRKKKELTRLCAELQPLDTKRLNSTAAAKEARRRKEAALGGGVEELEEIARWHRASEAGLLQVMEMEG